MKKVLTLALVLIMGLVIFSGCDNMDNPAESPVDSKMYSNNLSNNGISTNFKYIKYEMREINPRIYIAEKTYFLKLIYAGIEQSKISFVKDEYSKPFSRKIIQVYDMIQNKNYFAAVKKIDKDLNDKVDKWVMEEYKSSLYQALEITSMLCSIDYETCYVNIDYFDYLDTINVYCWLQELSGKQELIIQFESNNNIFLEDSVFNLFGSLPSTNQTIWEPDGFITATEDGIPMCDCTQPYHNSCKCRVIILCPPCPVPAIQNHHFELEPTIHTNSFE